MVKAPAKVNLFLDVKYKRDDGYHELETVMQQINLVDDILIESCARGIKIYIDRADIPDNEDNLVYRAAEKILNRYAPQSGVKITVKKNIPVGAGLAGGSTDAAATLMGINRLYNLGISQRDLMGIAAELGSDVPFCLMGKTLMARIKLRGEWQELMVPRGSTALGLGRGERLTQMNDVALNMVLVKPPFSLSTSYVYQNLDLNIIEKQPNIAAFIEAWNHCDIISIAARMKNVLESVSTTKYPEITNIKEQLLNLGAAGAIMSGSGPSVVGVFLEKNLAVTAVNILKKRYEEVYLVSSYCKGGYYGKKAVTRKSGFLQAAQRASVGSNPRGNY
ncbi:MAG: 4-(cytidine 5'-diphospho)-2-C-methyl-D-erythritol kinase [Syntrophomonadaceae bacterium]|nr:4-(cytidine 5'-diphospho)-2-C-methyl-D-erythritol kinase [Syntrophomonadaceae bacterium]